MVFGTQALFLLTPLETECTIQRTERYHYQGIISLGCIIYLVLSRTLYSKIVSGVTVLFNVHEYAKRIIYVFLVDYFSQGSHYLVRPWPNRYSSCTTNIQAGRLCWRARGFDSELR